MRVLDVRISVHRLHHHLLLSLFILCISQHFCYAQENDTSSFHDVKMNEIVISAGKFKENKKNIPQYLQTISQKEIEWSLPQTSATVLEQSGNVFVQRSQAGGGSPVLRGFEANRVLLIIDGVRMNNAIYRGGHLQNVITIDNNILERVEVLYGPSSTLYGSDALGGVMLFTSKQPTLSEWPTKPLFKTNFMTRYSSANNEGTGHVDFNIGFKKIALLTSVTYSKFSDTRAGNIRTRSYHNFGLRTFYAGRKNDTDITRLNNDANVQKFTGYTQVDLMQKLFFKQNEKINHTLNFQYSTSSDVPRYDRLTDVRNGSLRFAEWYYGPQERTLASYQIKASKLKGIFNEIHAGLNYQSIQESRHQRNYGDSIKYSRIEQLDVVGYNIDARKKIIQHEITVGTDGQYNYVKSNAFSSNINSNTKANANTRYPDGGSSMSFAAVYAQHLWKVYKGKIIISDGIRLNYIHLRSRFVDKTFFPFPFNNAQQENTALSGNLGMVYLPSKNWRFTINGATGFRAPNVDDIGKVFDTRAGELLIVPNPNLQPEYTYNTDVGINYTNNKLIKIEVNGFYTWLRNAIVQDAFLLNGSNTIIYDGQPTAIVANQNKARAYIYGFNTAITLKPLRHLTVYSTINYTYGRYFAANGKVPMDHIPPLYGKTSITYQTKKYRVEAFAMYNGWKKLRDYSPSGEDNIKYATVDGMPAWYTLNMRSSYNINKNISIQIALENILDQHYRAFASGVSAPGRNLILTFRAIM